MLLNSGYEMPILGLGKYALDYDTCVSSVKTLLRYGGRLIDTAYNYESWRFHSILNSAKKKQEE